jgi:hypothetical protein
LVQCDWRNRNHQKREAYSKLRPGRQRPSDRRAAEKPDERAPFHCPMPPVLRQKRIAYLGAAGETAALRDFNPAYVAVGSKRELPSSSLMSAFAGCGPG